MVKYRNRVWLIVPQIVSGLISAQLGETRRSKTVAVTRGKRNSLQNRSPCGLCLLVIVGMHPNLRRDLKHLRKVLCLRDNLQASVLHGFLQRYGARCRTSSPSLPRRHLVSADPALDNHRLAVTIYLDVDTTTKIDRSEIQESSA